MTRIIAKAGKIYFESVRMGLENCGITFTPNHMVHILQWHDSLKEKDFWEKLYPWQVTNRIPSASVLTRKASLAKITQEIQKIFPSEFNFIPKSYIIPEQYDEFIEVPKTTKKTWIVKPDGGSLGKGIIIIEPGQKIDVPRQPAVAQEYIDSITIDNRKFDFRIYVLVASIKPLRIYVYRNGLGRFCSEEVGIDPIFSRLTNVTLNKQHNSDFKIISRMIVEILPELKKLGLSEEDFWNKVDDCAAKTILSAINLLTSSESIHCPACGYSRCFQIFGFDIIFDKQLNPFVLEVNYRPNLDYHRGVERRMKSQMISDAIKLAVPLSAVQSIISQRFVSWDPNSWRRFVRNQFEIMKAISGERFSAEKSTNYHSVYMSNCNDNPFYDRLYSTILKLPISSVPGYEITHYKLDGEA